MNHSDILPLAERLPAGLSAVEVFCRLEKLPHVVFFDSASCEGQQGRYSFVAADPFQWITRPADGSDALAVSQSALKQYPTLPRTDLPPFQGGAAGLFGYELARSLEVIPTAAINDFPMPALAVGLYDTVVAFDHEANEAWIVSQGFPETDPQARRERAESRLEQMKRWLTGDLAATADGALPQTTVSQLAPQFDVEAVGVTSNLSPRAYRQMVERAVEYIHAGDVFQVNLSQRLLCPAWSNSVELYLRLREKNPAPYAGYFDLGDWQICSSSPECFLTLRDGEVETRPIKGTRGRSGMPEADLFAGDELQASEKDRAENVMIVDLLRNDLSRVCQAESVHVAQLCQVETYAFVKHLVSTVRGRLEPGACPLDLLRACFPGGSITGAPKIRAMEIIAELEPTCRGAYCGSLAYVGFDGRLDSSILIRTITAGHGWWQLPVGGGIVAQSRPDDEYRETWHKARGLLKALGVESPESRARR
ncbi:MAG: anthranilate synthase component I family protein [Planctomycetes bacterium]|nr:anthranilate synthase component I family protein [Planctomycetota bacterium]